MVQALALIRVSTGFIYIYCVYSFFAFVHICRCRCCVFSYCLQLNSFRAITFVPGILLWLLLNCCIQVSCCTTVFLILCYYSFSLLHTHNMIRFNKLFSSVLAGSNAKISFSQQLFRLNTHIHREREKWWQLLIKQFIHNRTCMHSKKNK